MRLLSLGMFAFIFTGVLTGASGAETKAGDPPALTPVASPPGVQALLGSSYSFFQITEVKSYSVTNALPTRRTIDLYLAIEVGSPWLSGDTPVDALSSEIPKAIRIFNTCAFGFDQIHFLYLTYNAAGANQLSQFASSSPYDPPFEFALYQDMPASLRPMVIFNRQGYAESFNLDAIGNLTPIYNVPISRIQDISFVPSDTAFGYNARMLTQPSFSLLAHEMAHVIGNLEHIQIPTANLMNVYQSGSTQEVGQAMSGDLDADQCQAILNWASH
ncbi:MAG: hypothetical protein P4M08_14900 [Oligoflexia bacterium]|nr:hypothetical protein [Oligoflexia bacterium]